MSAEEPNIHVESCDENAAPYVLGALTDEEHVAFAAHLESCAACREEVAALQVVASALAAAVPQLRVPGEVRERVMATVQKDASLHDRDASSQELPRPVRRSARSSWSAWRPALLGAAMAAVLVALLAVVLASGGDSGSARVVRAEVLAPRASATVRISDGHAELNVAGMPQPTPGRVYEVWIVHSGAPQPTDALFTVSGSGGNATVGVPGGTSGVKEILVTSEPLGGSRAPTRNPVIIARVS